MTIDALEYRFSKRIEAVLAAHKKQRDPKKEALRLSRSEAAKNRIKNGGINAK